MALDSFPSAPRIRINPLIPRLTHWINALAIFIMVGSGWRIYNSEPIVPSLIPYFNHRYTLGGDFELSFQLHGEPGLAGATLWHFAGMWLLVGNFLIWLTYGLLSGRFHRKLLPIRPREVLRDMLAAMRFRLPHEVGVYNAVQRLLYVGVLALITLTILSGLAIWKPVQLQELTWLLGGFQSARVIHFLGMAGIVLFVIVHLALVALVPRTLVSMVTGYAHAHPPTTGDKR
ncbi:MAG: cytochrome b/b6 domain-containing protein [Pseudomonadota bacterium]